MIKKYFTKVFVYQIILSSLGFSQVVFEPVEKEIYNFLLRQNNKGLVSFNESILPLSRLEIASLLTKLNEANVKLSTLEKNELDYYLNEYGLETDLEKGDKNLNNENGWIEFDKYKRLRLFHSYAEDFNFVLEPLASYSYSQNGDYSKHTRSWGFRSYGYLDNFGFQLDFTDNVENGDLINPLKLFNSERGINIRGGAISDEFDYSYLNAGITYNWSWGHVSFQKNYSLVGSGNFSRLIISDKAPSYPKIELDLKFTDWLRLYYFHGWLHSDLIDSSTFRTNNLVEGRDTYDRRQRYIAFHVFSITPNQNWTINLGESIIYSDRIEPIYLIPVMFYRLADNQIQRSESDTGDNAQIFLDVNYKNYYLRTKFYSTLFIDELSFGAVSGDDKAPASVGYTFGAQTSDFPFKNSLLSIEYSRLNPFLYMNSNPAQLYESHSYSLGHWIGSNSDIINFSYFQKIYRWFDFKLYYSYIRKGDDDLPEAQYQTPYPDFLHGKETSYSNLGLELNANFYNTFNILAKYVYQTVSNKKSIDITTPVNQSNFLFQISYGLY